MDFGNIQFCIVTGIAVLAVYFLIRPLLPNKKDSSCCGDSSGSCCGGKSKKTKVKLTTKGR